MKPSDWIDLIQIFFAVIGGIWVGYVFFLKREKYPKVEFTLDLKIIDASEKLVVEFVANLENKGTVRHYINVSTFILKLRYVTEKDINSLSNHTILKHKQQTINFFTLNFPHSVKPDFGYKEILWVPKEWEFLFVDAGTKQSVKLPLVLPKDIKWLSAKSEFKYRDRKSGDHSTQSLFNVHEMQTSATIR